MAKRAPTLRGRQTCERRGSYLGPGTVISCLLESILPSPVQTAPSLSQSSVTGSAMLTAPFESGLTATSHDRLLPCSSRRASVTVPAATVNSWSRRVL